MGSVGEKGKQKAVLADIVATILAPVACDTDHAF